MNELLGWYGYGKEAALSRISSQVQKKLGGDCSGGDCGGESSDRAEMVSPGRNKLTGGDMGDVLTARNMPLDNDSEPNKDMDRREDDRSSVCSGKEQSTVCTVLFLCSFMTFKGP